MLRRLVGREREQPKRECRSAQIGNSKAPSAGDERGPAADGGACARARARCGGVEQQRLMSALAEATEQVDHELGAVRDINRAAESLRASAEVAELATERESTGAALESVLEQWLALGVAKSLLEECLAHRREIGNLRS